MKTAIEIAFEEAKKRRLKKHKDWVDKKHAKQLEDSIVYKV